MKVSKLILENYRGYKERTEVVFKNLTTLIGRNDIGKSSILEALDVFFNESKANVKLDKTDSNVNTENEEITIGVEFIDFPESLIVDSTVETSLKGEYLINAEGKLEIHKKFKNGKLLQTSLIAYYPQHEQLADLHILKRDELIQIVEENNIDVEDKRKSSLMRKAIINHFKDDFSFDNKEILLDKEGVKQIWNKLKEYLPIYSLFQSDRKNEDQDTEIQDPMKLAIKEILMKQDLASKLEEVSQEVKKSAKRLAELTLEKLEEMNPEIAEELSPDFKEPSWESVFKYSITSDKGVALNKRGSGVRRLILLNFFRAEAERRKQERNVPNIIYAFEEPETSQHPIHQKLLIESFIELAESDMNQVILTTHSPSIARILPEESLRLLKKDENDQININYPSDFILKEITSNLGILPDIELENISNVKLALCVEGKNDISFLKNINDNIAELKEIIDLNDEQIIVLPMGGSTLQFWVNNNYLDKLNLSQVHIYDSDHGSDSPNKYRKYVDKINSQPNSKAFETNMRELENYISPDVLQDEFGDDFYTNVMAEKEDWQYIDVPSLFAKITHNKSESDKSWEEVEVKKKEKKISKAKNKINDELSKKVTKENLESIGAYDEVKSWFMEIRRLVDDKVGAEIAE